MNRWSFIKLCIFMVFQILISGISLCNESNVKPTLSIELYNSNLIQGEPISVRITVENNSKEPIANSFSGIKDFEKSAEFSFSIQDSNDMKIFEILMYVNTFPNSDIIRLVKPNFLPGDSLVCEKMFLPWLNLKTNNPFSFRNKAPDKIDFLPADSYKLTAKLRWMPVDMESYHIVSEPVNFKISEPSGIDIRAVKLFNTGDIISFYEGYLGSEPASVSTLLKEYPNSTYAKYSQLRLILDQVDIINNAHRIDIPKEEVETLISKGLNLAEKHKDMPLQDDNLLACSDMARAIGEEQECIRIMNLLVKNYPESNSSEIAQTRLINYSQSPDQKQGLEQIEQQTYPEIKKPIGVALPIAAAVAAIAIAGLVLFTRKKNLNKA